MKFLITSMIMFLTLLIININIQTINGLKNRMRFTSQLENLKDKYKEKILYGDSNKTKLMSDTTVIATLEDKIKTIYQKLNLNTVELIHLKKITTNVDEYIVFLKILIDKLSTLRKFEKSVNQINRINGVFDDEKDKDNQKKRDDLDHTKSNLTEKKIKKSYNESFFKNQTLINHSSSDKLDLYDIENERKSNNKFFFLKNESFENKIKSKKHSFDANIEISLRANCSKNKSKTNFKNESVSKMNKINPDTKGSYILNKEDREFLKKFNLLNLKKHGFRYNFTDLITELIKFKVWKLNHLKLKPLVNKGENLNYFQKSEKKIHIENLDTLCPQSNISINDNVTKLPLIPNNHKNKNALGMNKTEILDAQKLKMLKDTSISKNKNINRQKNKTDDVIKINNDKNLNFKKNHIRQNQSLINTNNSYSTLNKPRSYNSNQSSLITPNDQSNLNTEDLEKKSISILNSKNNNRSNKNFTSKINKEKITENTVPSLFDKLDENEKEPSIYLKIENVINFTLDNNKADNTSTKNTTANNSNSDLIENLFLENYTDSEVNNDLINKKINKEFNINEDNDLNYINDNFTLPNFVLLNITDSDKHNITSNPIKENENKNNISSLDLENKKVDLRTNNTKNNSYYIRSNENFPLSVLSNNDIFEDRNFELYLLNKKKQDKNNTYFDEMLKNSDLNDTEAENIREMQLDDLSEKFKIYLQDTKKQKQEFEEERNSKQKNDTLNEKSNIIVISSTPPKIINQNITKTVIQHNKTAIDNNSTKNNQIINFDYNQDINKNKTKNFLKHRKLLIEIEKSGDNTLDKKNEKGNSSEASEKKSFYGDNFMAYAKNRKNLENDTKNQQKDSEINKNSEDNSNANVTKNDKYAKTNSKNNNLKDSKKTEGQMLNILFSLIFIGLLLAGLCWLIFLMFMKTNKD